MALGLFNTLDPLPPAVGSNSPPSPSIQEARRVASEFESLLIGQILQSMGSAAEGSLWGGEDSSATSIVEFAQEHLAKCLAAGGGLGIAKVVEQGLRQKSSA